jgi:hypothetical protein
LKRSKNPNVEVVADFGELGLEYPFTTIDMRLSHFRALQVEAALFGMGLHLCSGIRSSLRLLAVVRRTREIPAIASALGRRREEILESILCAVGAKLDSIYPDKGRGLVDAAMKVLQTTRDAGGSPPTDLVNRDGRALAQQLASVLNRDVVVGAGFHLPQVQQPTSTVDERRGAQMMADRRAKNRSTSANTRATS